MGLSLSVWSCHFYADEIYLAVSGSLDFLSPDPSDADLRSPSSIADCGGGSLVHSDINSPTLGM